MVEIPALVVILLPIVFMLHDFEEVVFMESWYEHKHDYLRQRVPRFYPTIEKMMQGRTTSGFALSVAMMFLLVSACTLFSVITENYLVWWSAFLVFSLHLLMHIGQSLVLRSYVPAVVTSVLCLPYAVWGFTVMHVNFTLKQTLLSLVVSLPIVAVYLAFAHWVGKSAFKVRSKNQKQ